MGERMRSVAVVRKRSVGNGTRTYWKQRSICSFKQIEKNAEAESMYIIRLHYEKSDISP